MLLLRLHESDFVLQFLDKSGHLGVSRVQVSSLECQLLLHLNQLTLLRLALGPHRLSDLNCLQLGRLRFFELVSQLHVGKLKLLGLMPHSLSLNGCRLYRRRWQCRKNLATFVLLVELLQVAVSKTEQFNLILHLSVIASLTQARDFLLLADYLLTLLKDQSFELGYALGLVVLRELFRIEGFLALAGLELQLFFQEAQLFKQLPFAVLEFSDFLGQLTADVVAG